MNEAEIILFTRLEEGHLIPILAPTRDIEKSVSSGSLIPVATHRVLSLFQNTSSRQKSTVVITKFTVERFECPRDLFFLNATTCTLTCVLEFGRLALLAYLK